MERAFVKLPSQEIAEKINEFIQRKQLLEWVIETEASGITLSGYFPKVSNEDITVITSEFTSLNLGMFRVEKVVKKDWSNEYKKFLTPFSIGSLHIVPVWEKETYNVPAGELVVYIDSEMAFGTGAHETTKLCLARIIDFKNLFRDMLFLKSFIDVGCGSGILSLAAAKIGVANVYGFDVDEHSVEVSRKNAKVNEVSNGIEFVVGNIQECILGHQADMICANILAPTLMENASILVNTIKQYGMLSLSGILIEESMAVKDVFEPLVNRYWDSFMLSERKNGSWIEICYMRG
ncbi:MAG: 50S ribosomal protein L11 methyltransferase [Puniceicoccales bacterium]|jgi:ribosomal protein L11 methyltransferase|nr:50S ribosomal protein L11 methyltransferase [Puniceicoccales bacterium]